MAASVSGRQWAAVRRRLYNSVRPLMAGYESITALLAQWREGDGQALDTLMPLVYGNLRRIARHQIAGEGAGHTLSPTALVHEAVLRLLGADVHWQDRAHFLAIAARQMRRVLVEYARAQHRQKRGAPIGSA